MKKKPKKNKPIHPVTQYARDVSRETIPANKWIKLACKRHMQDLKTAKKRGLYFDEAAADHIIAFFPEFLSFYEGAFDGQPFELTPSQKFIVGSLFGWKRKADGFRRFRTAYIEMSKGMGKSPLGAGIGLYCLVFDDEPGSECYAAATTRDQAGVAFRDARLYAEEGLDKFLEEGVDLDVGLHNIAYIAENSFFRPVSSEHRGLDGKKPHYCLIDEIHEHPTDLVVRKMSAGTKTRRQSLIFEITNAGYDRLSICYQHHEYSEKVLEGLIQDDSWFALMSGLDVCQNCAEEGKTIPQDGCPDCDDWRDEAVWEKANPNLHYLGAPFLDYLHRQVDEAKAMPPQESIVKRLNFCIWCVAPWTFISMADGSRKRADELQPGDLILSFDEKTRKLKKTHVIQVKDNGIHPVIRIKTVRGREIVVTENHKFWSRYGRTDNPKYGWIEANKIKKGSRIAVGLGHDLPRGSRRMNSIEAHFLGIMIGDGTCAKPQLRVTNNNDGIINFCRSYVETKGCSLKSSDGSHWNICHSVKQRTPKQTAIRTLIKKHNLNGKTCFNKRVPIRVFKGGPNVWAAFLSGYLDTDGWITGRSIQWISVNRLLLEDCQHLLALLGVQSAVRHVRNNEYRLEVMMAENLRKLSKLLKLSHIEKKKRLEPLKSIRTEKNMKDRSDFDLVKSATLEKPQRTIGIEIEHTHTHITNGLITHNTEGDIIWMPAEKWAACRDNSLKIEDFKGQSCYAGLDLASKIDICSLILVFPFEKGFAIFNRNYLCEETIKNNKKKQREQYELWVRQGHIIQTPGARTDQKFIEDDLKAINEDHPIIQLGFDPREAGYIIANVMEWTAEDVCVEITQGPANMSEPMKELEARIAAQQIWHDGNPVLAWMISNVVLKQSRGGPIKYYYPTKANNENKIDGAVALIMAISRAMLHIDTKSIYEERGILIL